MGCRHGAGQVSRQGEGSDFPYNSISVGTAFRRACADADVKDLHFHDLRHEGTSRLFEVGLSIEQVALVTGHKDWKMLRRYTHIRLEELHRLVASQAPYPAENFAAE
jgi:integrase